MQSSYPARFEREMSCSEGEWLALLPRAIGPHALHIGNGSARIELASGELLLSWREGEPFRSGLVRLPRLHVVFAFEGVEEAARHAFMKRFDLYTQRGGG